VKKVTEPRNLDEDSDLREGNERRHQKATRMGKQSFTEKSGCNRAVGEDVSLDGLLSVRCTKQQKRHYSGKQKCHTVKSQVLVNQKTQEIICVAVREGKVHDFRIWKESQIGIEKKTELL
jgi:hypothetical protein